jgi:hypothetical protein
VSALLPTQASEARLGRREKTIVCPGLTVLSTIVFRELKSTDGDTVSQHKILTQAGRRF